ncbi:MAG TPA: radical SAM protein [Patescibacteria group bacterium]|nr:radical SAM protein [Patescibacteria group bacterium]
MYPSYLDAHRDGSLAKVAEEAHRILKSCALCPRRCGVNRLNNEVGFCKTGSKARVYNCISHHGEEPPISGTRGSGAIFFSGCTMGCVYCQNYEFSQFERGTEMTDQELADSMICLQEAGCHNINLVTPTHLLPQILAALCLAIPKGLNIPLVYNTSGYELPAMVKMLAGIVDVYLPDMRYADAESAARYSACDDYPAYNQEAVRQMHLQVGIPVFDEPGIIRRGLIIRHLVLPNAISGTEKIAQFISRELSSDTYISLMSQYFPCYKAHEFTQICRRLSSREYRQARDILEKYDLHNGWFQDGRGLLRFVGTRIKPACKDKP